MKHQNKFMSTIAAAAIISSSTLYAQTNTGLDKLVEIIQNDRGLQKKVSETDIATAADAADRMNEIILEAMDETQSMDNGMISTDDVRNVNRYIVQTHAQEWTELHGDDEKKEETGFHLVQNDGAKTKLFGKNAVNQVADGIYHLGFPTDHNKRLLNEDGNKNKSFKRVALWLNKLLKDDLAAIELSDQVVGTTESGLDVIIDYMYSDAGLQKRISVGDIHEAAKAADRMNQIIITSIQELGLGTDGEISKNDVRELNQYIVANYQEEWKILHGDDEQNEETGFHLVQNDGAKTKLFGKNLFNSVADGIYHLGFPTNSTKRLQNEDGNANKSFRKVAIWLNKLLAEDLKGDLL
ncbi:MAG: hypothetical protein K0U47_05575 [Epsilonproteobacteria bacterium]|nr:hypothetical protein [Campylobacterota bacterium]